MENNTIVITLYGLQGWFNIYKNNKGITTDNICHENYTVAQKKADKNRHLKETIFFKIFSEASNITYSQILKK